MEDIIYLAKKRIATQDIILQAKEFNFSCEADPPEVKADFTEVRVIPCRGTYWDFTDYTGTPDYQCVEESRLALIKRYAPISLLLITHSYDTRPMLVRFVKKLIEKNGGGLVTDGDFADIDELENVDAYIRAHCS